MASFVLSFFPLDVLDGIWDLIESVSDGFLTYSCTETLLLQNLNYPKPAGPRSAIGGHLTRKSGVLGSIPGLATYFHFSFCFFKKGSCQLLAKVCARSTG